MCEGARAVADAPVAALFEPAPGGATLVAKACVGAEMVGFGLPLRGEGGAALAFARAEEVFVALDDDLADPDRDFMNRARARAVLLLRPTSRSLVEEQFVDQAASRRHCSV